MVSERTKRFKKRALSFEGGNTKTEDDSSRNQIKLKELGPFVNIEEVLKDAKPDTKIHPKVKNPSELLEETVEDEPDIEPDITDETEEAYMNLVDDFEELAKHMSRPERDAFMRGLIALAKKRARKDFYTYVKLMAPLILPEGYKDGRHIEIMAKELQRIEKNMTLGKPTRTMIFLPPGSMKSKILNLFVTWCYGRNPKRNILHLGYATQFAEDNFGRPIRDIMRTPEYLEVFPKAVIRSDSRASGRMDLIEGGKYYATGVCAQIAGRRAHLSICDDVISEQTAYSDAERTKVNKWYGPGLRTRLLPNASEIIVNTRYHMDDISGALLKWDEKSKIRWKVIKFPAFVDEASHKLLGIPIGESYWPELWPKEVLLEKKNDPSMSEAKWNSLYMQDPTPEEGNILKEEFFMKWKEDAPEVLETIMSVDTAFSTKMGADYSAYSVWGVFLKKDKDFSGKTITTANMILLQCERGRWDFPSLCERIQEAYEYYDPNVILIENKASGQSLIQEFHRRRLPVEIYQPDKDKVSRVHACVPFFKSGRIWVPVDKETGETPKWAQELIVESLQFPFGTHDDLVDTMSQVILWARDSYSVSNPNYPKGYTEEELDEDDVNNSKNRNKLVSSYWKASYGKSYR